VVAVPAITFTIIVADELRRATAETQFRRRIGDANASHAITISATISVLATGSVADSRGFNSDIMVDLRSITDAILAGAVRAVRLGSTEVFEEIRGVDNAEAVEAE
jgi:hypothetical protein